MHSVPVTRRNVMGQTLAAGAAGLVEPASAATRREGQPGRPGAPDRKLKVIVCGGHPGDPEYGCGGTVARYTDLGHEVVLLYLNDGEWPPDKAPEAGGFRMAEAKKACEILKARPLHAGQLNGKAIVDADHYESFRKILEAEGPDVLFTQWPIDNHADHRAISMLAYDAWLKMGKKFAFYYYEVSNGEDTVHFAPTHYVDITAVEPGSARRATPTPARRRTSITACRSWSRGCAGSRADIARLKGSSATCKARTSGCRWREPRTLAASHGACPMADLMRSRPCPALIGMAYPGSCPAISSASAVFPEMASAMTFSARASRCSQRAWSSATNSRQSGSTKEGGIRTMTVFRRCRA